MILTDWKMISLIKQAAYCRSRRRREVGSPRRMMVNIETEETGRLILEVQKKKINLNFTYISKKELKLKIIIQTINNVIFYLWITLYMRKFMENVWPENQKSCCRIVYPKKQTDFSLWYIQYFMFFFKSLGFGHWFIGGIFKNKFQTFFRYRSSIALED